MDKNENLTQLGRHLVDMPVEPRLAKMLIYSVIFKCLDPVLTIVAILAYRDPFLLPSNSSQRILAGNIRKNFSANSFSDHMILLRAFQAWQESKLSKTERSFCNKNFISSATMEMVVDIRSQLLAHLRACGFVKTRPPGDIRQLNANANNWAMIKAVMTVGFYPNIAYINKPNLAIRTRKEKKVILHQSSSLRDPGFHNARNASLRKVPSNWLIFEELSRAGTIYNIRGATCVSPLTVSLFVDPSNINSFEKFEENKMAELCLNQWVIFHDSLQLTSSIVQLREKINNLILKKITFPYRNFVVQEEALINLVTVILTKEDGNLNLVAPPGIGARPKVLLHSNYPTVNDVMKHTQPKSKYSNWNFKNVPEVICFKKFNVPIYNQYTPHRVNTELPEINDPLACSKEPLADLSFPPENFLYSANPLVNFPSSNSVDSQPPFPAFDLTTINQSLLMMSLYNDPEVKPDYLTPQFFQNSNVQDDFDQNGVNVVEDGEVEGACALPPINTRIYPNEWINTYCNPAFTSYFIIKAGGMKSVDISISKKTWIFSPQTERKLLKLIQVRK